MKYKRDCQRAAREMAARAKADGGDLLAQAERVIDRHTSQNWKDRAKLEVGPFVRATAGQAPGRGHLCVSKMPQQ